MKKLNWLALGLGLTLFSGILAGCGEAQDAGDTETAATTTNETKAPEGTTAANTEGEAKPFMKDGKLWCAVMNEPVKSVEAAVGYQDVDGVRYYFCCGACPSKFKENPEKYITAMKTGQPTGMEHKHEEGDKH